LKALQSWLRRQFKEFQNISKILFFIIAICGCSGKVLGFVVVEFVVLEELGWGFLVVGVGFLFGESVFRCVAVLLWLCVLDE
jgi:hypothetical protein